MIESLWNLCWFHYKMQCVLVKCLQTPYFGESSILRLFLPFLYQRQSVPWWLKKSAKSSSGYSRNLRYLLDNLWWDSYCDKVLCCLCDALVLNKHSNASNLFHCWWSCNINQFQYHLELPNEQIDDLPWFQRWDHYVKHCLLKVILEFGCMFVTYLWISIIVL